MKKTDAPRTVTLPDGTILTIADLPKPSTRWVASRKATVVNAVKYGLISRDEALRGYEISTEEFDAWVEAINQHGNAALKVTHLQSYRQP